MVDLPEVGERPGQELGRCALCPALREAAVGVIELKTRTRWGTRCSPSTAVPATATGQPRPAGPPRKRALQFIAYYNVGLDNWYARRKPEWQCVDPAGAPKIGFGAYNWMCIRSPWRDVVLNECRQVQMALKPPGMWFDILGMPQRLRDGVARPGQRLLLPLLQGGIPGALRPGPAHLVGRLGGAAPRPPFRPRGAHRHVPRPDRHVAETRPDDGDGLQRRRQLRRIERDPARLARPRHLQFLRGQTASPGQLLRQDPAGRRQAVPDPHLRRLHAHAAFHRHRHLGGLEPDPLDIPGRYRGGGVGALRPHLHRSEPAAQRRRLRG